MATEKWIAGSGAGLTWTTLFSSGDVASLAAGNSVLSSVSVTNGTALDMFADISIISTTAISVTAPGIFGFYLYPLNEDGTTYGDGRFVSSASGNPPTQYYVSSVSIATSTAATLAGVATRVVLPPGTFSMVLYNNSGNALPSATATVIKYRTYNRQIA